MRETKQDDVYSNVKAGHNSSKAQDASGRQTSVSQQGQDDYQAMESQRADVKGKSAQQNAVGQEAASAQGGVGAIAQKSPAEKIAPTRTNGKNDALQGGGGSSTPEQEAAAVQSMSKSKGEQNAAQLLDGAGGVKASKGAKAVDAKGANQGKDASVSAKAKGEKQAKDGAAENGGGRNAQNAKEVSKGVESETGKKATAEVAGRVSEDQASQTAKASSEKKSASSEKKSASSEKASTREKQAKTGGKASGKTSGGGLSSKGGGAISVGGGGGGGGGISVPTLGGGAAQAPAPKGEVAGKNAIDGFAQSGLSYQIENQSGLGAKAEEDVAKKETELEGKLPGEEKAEINDGKADKKREKASQKSVKANKKLEKIQYKSSSNLNLSTVAQKLETTIKAKSQSVSGAKDDIPAKPTVESDTSGIEKGKAEETSKYTSAKNEGASKVASLNKDIPERGFSDMKAPKAVLEADSQVLQSSEASLASEVAQLKDDAKGLLDITELAEQSSSQMSGAVAKVDEAEAQSQAELDAKIASHNEEIETLKSDAEAEEKSTIEAKKAELDDEVQSRQGEYDSEIDSYDAEQQAEIESSRSEMESERAKAQAEIDNEHTHAQAEKKAAEEKAEKDKQGDKSWVEKAADWVKDKVDKIVSWLKEKVAEIVNKVKNAICKLLDGFASIVSRINKNLGEKLKKAFAKFKDFLDKFAQAIIDAVNKVLDAVAEAVKALVDRVAEAIQTAIDAFKAAVELIFSTLREGFKAALELVGTALSSLGEIFIPILKKAMELAGVDPGIFASAMGVAKEIIANPGQFFSALATGFVQGFKQFGANIRENVKAVFSNLFNMWLGTAGLSLPEFSVKGLIKFGLQVIGIDVESLLGSLGVEYGDINSVDDAKNAFWSTAAGRLIQDIQANGISALSTYLMSYLKDLAKSVMESAIESIVVKASTAAIAKLAMLSNPVSGIIAAIKAVYDLVQFVRSNMSMIGGLVEAVTNTLAQAATGDSSGVANGVEAALCRLIPLAIDLLLRLAGIDVGGAIQGIVTKIRGQVQGAVQSLIGKLGGTKVGKALKDGRKKIEEKKDAVKNGFNNTVDKGIAKVGSKFDPAINRVNQTTDKFGQTRMGKGLSSLNKKAQGVADKTTAWTKSKKESTAALNAKLGTATKVLNEFNKAEKNGDAFGLNAEKILASSRARKQQESEEAVEKAEESVLKAEAESEKSEAQAKVAKQTAPKQESQEEKKGNKGSEAKDGKKAASADSKSATGVKESNPAYQAMELNQERIRLNNQLNEIRAKIEYDTTRIEYNTQTSDRIANETLPKYEKLIKETFDKKNAAIQNNDAATAYSADLMNKSYSELYLHEVNFKTQCKEENSTLESELIGKRKEERTLVAELSRVEQQLAELEKNA